MAFQVDIAIRLVVSALIGAGLGLEREIHGHPAGMRTHMLVALGSAVFTVLSIYGFPQTAGAPAADPSRISAQIVTGIGFLGAGAIIKFGTSIRGLTTAASLWVVASLGLAAGAGAYFVALVGMAIGLAALWPARVLASKLELSGGRMIRLEIEIKKLDFFAGVTRVLLSHHIEIVSVSTEKSKAGHLVALEVRLPSASIQHAVLTDLESITGVEVRAVSRSEEA
jgi:putative Mg2+ transporter-C (MgtC) family protein